MTRPYRAGESLEDFCRACKTDRLHTVIAADAEGRPIRVSCGYCHSEHNYRGGPRVNEPASPKPDGRRRDPFPIVSDRERTAPPMAIDRDTDIELLLRRIIREETGITASAVTKLADIKYMYVRTWGDNERVFKIVSFYLLRYESGEIDHISDAMRIEVARASWVKLEDAPKLLAYKGEKQMARKALEYVTANTKL